MTEYPPTDAMHPRRIMTNAARNAGTIRQAIFIGASWGNLRPYFPQRNWIQRKHYSKIPELWDTM
jgi:hypothetical protein